MSTCTTKNVELISEFGLICVFIWFGGTSIVLLFNINAVLIYRRDSAEINVKTEANSSNSKLKAYRKWVTVLPLTITLFYYCCCCCWFLFFFVCFVSLLLILHGYLHLSAFRCISLLFFFSLIFALALLYFPCNFSHFYCICAFLNAVKCSWNFFFTNLIDATFDIYLYALNAYFHTFV